MSLSFLVWLLAAVISTIILFGLNKKIVIGFVLSSLVAGVAYWLLELLPYLLSSLRSHRIPLDALVLLVPSIGFSFLFSYVACPPAIYVLRKLDLFEVPYILLAAAAIAALVIAFVRPDYPWWKYVAAAGIGIIAGLVFVSMVRGELVARG